MGKVHRLLYYYTKPGKCVYFSLSCKCAEGAYACGFLVAEKIITETNLTVMSIIP